MGVAVDKPRTGGIRQVIGTAVVAALGFVIAVQVVLYLTHSSIKRPHDFLQVWLAGRLTLDGENPYDGDKMLELQLANQSPRPFASMMWVPPWGIALALPIGAMPIALAEGVWVFGQIGLILLSATMLWRMNGGRSERWWVPVVLVLAFGPVWWQTVVGQYAGLLMFGMVGFLAAHRANRPVLAGLSLTLIALKPHLFVLIAVGLVIDAFRTSFGRRVVLGGAIGLAAGAIAATIASPALWKEYFAAIDSEGTPSAPGIRLWFSPTIPAWIRHFVPGRPFWVQTVPAWMAAGLFALYWWKRGNPTRWPQVVNWVLPVCLLLAPYGSWPSDLTLLLVPIVAAAARVDARGWTIPGRSQLAATYCLANAGVVLMYQYYSGTDGYVWVAPVLCGCLLWLRMGLKPHMELDAAAAETNSERPALQPQTA